MNRDARTLDHKTLEAIRKLAVERVREGERPSEVIARSPLPPDPGWLAGAQGQAVKQYVAQLQGKLMLHHLPDYAPDLDPHALVWSYAKRTGTAHQPLQAGEKLEDRITQQLAEIGRQPALVPSFFMHPCLAYISDCWVSPGILS